MIQSIIRRFLFLSLIMSTACKMEDYWSPSTMQKVTVDTMKGNG